MLTGQLAQLVKTGLFPAVELLRTVPEPHPVQIFRRQRVDAVRRRVERDLVVRQITENVVPAQFFQTFGLLRVEFDRRAHAKPVQHLQKLQESIVGFRGHVIFHVEP